MPATPMPTPAPAPSRAASLRAVERAAGDLRRGDPVLVRPDRGPAMLALAAETASDAGIARVERLTGRVPWIVLTGQRAVALGLSDDPSGVLRIAPAALPDVVTVRDLADPTRRVEAPGLAGCRRTRIPADARDGEVEVTRLTKIARLLPAALVVPVDRPLGADRLLQNADILSVGAFDIDGYERHAARSLTRVAQARVPIEAAEATRIVAFRPADGGLEHLAIVIGDPDPADAVLVRLHSECFTGDLIGSLRCDCGQQLRGALAEIARAGSGVLLYLAQEGRGIGLINKLRAYSLQDQDFDTVDANEMLGYGADERVYLPAAEMLHQLGITRVRLMTNNPDKCTQLAGLGIEVADRVSHVFPANGHNEFYLRTKKERSGHLL